MIYSQWNPTRNIRMTNFEIYADPDDDEDPPDLPPIMHSPIPEDSIIILSNGDIIILGN
jgi:hypothetical protein